MAPGFVFRPLHGYKHNSGAWCIHRPGGPDPCQLFSSAGDPSAMALQLAHWLQVAFKDSGAHWGMESIETNVDRNVLPGSNLECSHA